MGKRKAITATNTHSEGGTTRMPRRAVASPVPGRTFEGLPNETDWMALHAIVPAATGAAKLRPEHGGHEVIVTTLLPQYWAGLVRTDGARMVALQAASSTGDASRDVAAALLALAEQEPGHILRTLIPESEGPRLQDLLEQVPFAVSVYEDFSFVLNPKVDLPSDVAQAMESLTGNIAPTVKMAGVVSAYWSRLGAREFLRWVRPEEEDRVVNGLARLRAARDLEPFPRSKYVGAFRSDGLLAPVWELPRGTSAEEVEEGLPGFAEKLAAAIAIDEALNDDERRARAGLINRHVTVR